MHIETYGKTGRPCILLFHTMFTTGCLFQKLVPLLEQNFLLVIPTLDGYDPAEETEYPGADGELEQIEAFLKERQIPELTAVGSSLGAMLAWRLWQRGRVFIRKLVLDSPPFGWDAATAAQNAGYFWKLVQTVRAAPDTRCVFDEHYGEFGPMMRRSCSAVTENTIRRSCETCFGPRLPEQIRTGATKILLVYGEDDPNYRHLEKELAGRTDVSLAVEAGFGHCGFLMREPQKFAKLLMEE